MEDQTLLLLLHYPLITVESKGKKKFYKGIITVGDKDYDVHVEEKIKNRVSHFRLKSAFEDKITGATQKIQASNIVEYLDYLKTILRSHLVTNDKNPVNIYRKILYEYAEFTRFHLNMKSCQLSSDLSSIRISVIDDGGREHFLQITVDLHTNKDIFQCRNIELPPPYYEEISKHWSNLTTLYNNFLSAIENLQSFFNVMNNLDKNCCILDPEKPTRRDCYRRIWIDHNLSIVVTVDPLNVRARPDIKFLGPERVVEKFRTNLNAKLEEWNQELSLSDALLDILEMTSFPFKPDERAASFTNIGECCICFSARLNDKLPEIICGNKFCETFYHQYCLYEWLTSINSKRVFNQIHGQCPNCEKGISCDVPD